MNPLREGLQRQRVPEPCIMVIFGASGDLAHRKLIPAIYSLAHEGSLPPYFALVGVAVSDFTSETFREDMKKAVQEFSRHRPVNQAVWDNLAANMHYIKGDFQKNETFQGLRELMDRIDRE